jgi:hypothetical protein
VGWGSGEWGVEGGERRGEREDVVDYESVQNFVVFL